uniref:Uncharacterized protein n=1 Tax=Naja naja TaxID=35670 RepID=A0A8C6YFW2_NAJNA
MLSNQTALTTVCNVLYSSDCLMAFCKKPACISSFDKNNNQLPAGSECSPFIPVGTYPSESPSFSKRLWQPFSHLSTAAAKSLSKTRSSAASSNKETAWGAAGERRLGSLLLNRPLALATADNIPDPSSPEKEKEKSRGIPDYEDQKAPLTGSSLKWEEQEAGWDSYRSGKP